MKEKCSSEQSVKSTRAAKPLGKGFRRNTCIFTMLWDTIGSRNEIDTVCRETFTNEADDFLTQILTEDVN